MKRLRRWLFNGLAALSLLLCVATVVLWIVSYRQSWDWNRDHWNERERWVDVYDLTDTPPGHVTLARVRQSFVDQLMFDDILHAADISGKGSSGADSRSGWERIQPDESITWPQGTDAFNRGGYRWGHEPRKPFWGDMRADGFNEAWWLVIPLWSLAVLFAVLPTARLVIFFARNRRKAGFCSVCGYDLRATPERCPECGGFQKLPLAHKTSDATFHMKDGMRP